MNKETFIQKKIKELGEKIIAKLDLEARLAVLWRRRNGDQRGVR